MQTLTPSLEDYLEAISYISKERPAVRAKDISARLSVGSSSVTGAMRALAERDLVNYAPYDLITLTEEGRRVGAQIIRRHEVLRSFLTEVLAVDETEAERNACRMEHAISREIVERFVKLKQFIENSPDTTSRWIKDFKRYCEAVDDGSRGASEQAS